MIEPAGNQIPDKTWCYWSEKPLEIHPNANIHFWKNLTFISNESEIVKNLGSLNYYHLNSHDFYMAIFKKIKAHPNVKMIKDEVIELVEKNNSVEVKTKTNGSFHTRQVMDSRLDGEKYRSTSDLKQVFTGWRIKTDQAVFDPQNVVLMEFPAFATKQFEFIYILPFSSTEALVEFTAYTQVTPSPADLEASLKLYLNAKLGDVDYEITFRESGVIPMTTRKEPSKAHKNILKIGTNAGWTKASTGYTFHKIQTNCKRIVEALESGNLNQLQFRNPSRFTFYDNILLNIAHKWPHRLQSLFLNLFTTSSAEVVLRFLQEETSFREELVLLGKLQFPIFIKSLMNYEAH